MDNAVEFYTRVNFLVPTQATVVDFGAGRGQWFVDSRSEVRRRLRDLRGEGRTVIGIDVDPAVKTNPSVDEAHVVGIHEPLPIASESVDVVISDFTFEHIADPSFTARELGRVVRPGGWICARTPNKYGYIGIGARVVPNQHHARLVRLLQPSTRRDEDVFPVQYRLNTVREITRNFPAPDFKHIIYTMPTEPDYAGTSRILWRIFSIVQRLQPRVLQPMLCIFLQKQSR